MICLVDNIAEGGSCWQQEEVGLIWVLPLWQWWRWAVRGKAYLKCYLCIELVLDVYSIWMHNVLMSVINVCSINLEMMWSRGTSSPLKRRWWRRSGPKDLVRTTTGGRTSTAAPTAAGPSPGLGCWSIWWNIVGLHQSAVMSTRSGLSILPSTRSWETLTCSCPRPWLSYDGGSLSSFGELYVVVWWWKLEVVM